GLVITDMARKPSDYARMGLPTNDKSMHYEQPDGWVHAVDLRTKSNGEITNWAVQRYFDVMGFSTLRHVGTADHLHVQMRRLDYRGDALGSFSKTRRNVLPTWS